MTVNYFNLVKEYLTELDVDIVEEDAARTLFVVEDESRGISNLIVDCEEELLVIEQVIFEVSTANADMFKRLLQMNREFIHGAFVLDEDGRRVLFRDTLQLANLDLNELDASINALALGLASFASELIDFAKSA